MVLSHFLEVKLVQNYQFCLPEDQGSLALKNNTLATYQVVVLPDLLYTLSPSITSESIDPQDYDSFLVLVATGIGLREDY